MKFIPNGPIDNNLNKVSLMAWCQTGNKLHVLHVLAYYPSQWLSSLLMFLHVYVTRQVEPFVASDDRVMNMLTLRHRSLLTLFGDVDLGWQSSALAQVMAWCLTAPCHYLDQCWLIISVTDDKVTMVRQEWGPVYHHQRAISRQRPQPSIMKISLEITYLYKFH